MPKSPEALQQQAVLDFLTASHICAFRMNSGAMLAEHDGKKRMIRYGVEGMADILSFPWFEGDLHPVPLWIEMKSATGRQTASQKSFQFHVELHGMHYIVARSIEDVERWLQKNKRRAA